MFQIQFLTISIKDIIDILVVTFIVYQALKLTRGTRSAQIIVGLALLGLMAFGAYWFQLEGVTWLFSNVATFGVIALVIVFQPELRGALASIGQNRLLRIFVPLEDKAIVEEVSRAAVRLAELRYGALIVIERRTGLRNYAETGKLLSSELSAELLVTLFTPYTPLHDGAVIITGDTIVAAATSLPLTTNQRYRELFGMRHKAAIGVSEVSDAVVVCVSEETAGISVAFEGILEPDIPRQEFRDKLAAYLKK